MYISIRISRSETLRQINESMFVLLFLDIFYWILIDLINHVEPIIGLKGPAIVFLELFTNP